MKAPAERAPCDVAECRRTINRADLPEHFTNFLCSKHWALIPKAMKRVLARHERQFKKFGFYPREGYHRIRAMAWRIAGAS